MSHAPKWGVKNEDLECIENTLKSTAEKLEPVNSNALFKYKLIWKDILSTYFSQVNLYNLYNFKFIQFLMLTFLI